MKPLEEYEIDVIYDLVENDNYLTPVHEEDILIDDCDIELSPPRNIRKVKLKLKYAGKNGQRQKK